LLLILLQIITSESHSYYPELPSISSRQNVPVTSGAVQFTNYPMMSTMMERGDGAANRISTREETSLLNGVELLPQGGQSVLVDELLQENSRLLDEVTKLKAHLQAVQSQQNMLTNSGGLLQQQQVASVPPTAGVRIE
jgi:hypothetical protein